MSSVVSTHVYSQQCDWFHLALVMLRAAAELRWLEGDSPKLHETDLTRLMQPAARAAAPCAASWCPWRYNHTTSAELTKCCWCIISTGLHVWIWHPVDKTSCTDQNVWWNITWKCRGLVKGCCKKKKNGKLLKANRASVFHFHFFLCSLNSGITRKKNMMTKYTL